MKSSRILSLIAVGSCLIIASYFVGPLAQPKEPEEAFHKELLKIAADYKAWGRVDDQFRWAPTLCDTPKPGQVGFSESKDESTHGQKLYSLFASKREEYHRLPSDNEITVGQTIVKQSWVAEEITDPKLKPTKPIQNDKIEITPILKSDNARGRESDHFYPYVWKGDKVYKAAKQGDLFIMTKLDPKTPGTDDGWVYGTVSPDGKKVTSAGKVESCMKCHLEAKHERLFGFNPVPVQK